MKPEKKNNNNDCVETGETYKDVVYFSPTLLMEWNKVTRREDMPMDGRVFIALWKGRISLTSYCDVDEAFFIIFNPAEYENCWQIDRERESKFSHWMLLPPLPEDY